MNTGDTAFLLLSAALVMLMTPGLALFYGGMVRRKNILGTIMQSMIVIALVSVEWLFVGYSLSGAWAWIHTRTTLRPSRTRPS
jgi:Amt family ammonium transporter